jgi:hypothetical protein
MRHHACESQGHHAAQANGKPMTEFDAWVLRRLLSGHEVNGELGSMSTKLRPLAEYLAPLDAESRQVGWGAYLAGRLDHEAMINAVAAFDPDAPAPTPEAEGPIRPANLADVRAIASREQWLWPGYIPRSRVAGISAYEGVGKTRLETDLARRIYHALPWPDGQPATLPKGTPTLWVCADGQQDDLVAAAAACDLPDEAIWFNTPSDNPYGGTELDEDEDRERLEDFIGRIRPGLVFIDSLTYATSHDLCRADETKALMTPLRDITQRTQATIIASLHLSLEGQVLGRRAKGLCRVILQLDCPDPEQPERLKLWVARTFDKRPPPLGVKMTDAGNEYDDEPPEAAPRDGRTGRPPTSRVKAEAFIVKALTEKNDQVANDLYRAWKGPKMDYKTFWRAVDALKEAERLVTDGGPGTHTQTVLHLLPEPGGEAAAKREGSAKVPRTGSSVAKVPSPPKGGGLLPKAAGDPIGRSRRK